MATAWMWRAGRNKCVVNAAARECIAIAVQRSFGTTARICCAHSHKQDSTVEVPEFAHLRSHDEVYNLSIREPDIFWGTLAKSRLNWDKPFERVSNCDFAAGRIDWFCGGALNASVQCLDRHIPTRADQTALIWEGDEPGNVEKASYRELLALTCRTANVLKSLGVKRSDRVIVYLPSCILAAAVMQACVRIGAVHAVVFAGFSPESLATRIADSGAEVIVTMDTFFRGGVRVPLKQLVHAAVNSPQSGNKVRHVLVSRREPSYTDYPTDKRDLDLDAAIACAADTCPPESVSSEHPLYLLYTSGSTGRPKGLMHSTAGYLLHTLVAQRSVFGVREGDVFGCMADVGWLVGHTMTVYGSLLVGGTGFMTETTPTYPDAGRYWDMTERHGFTQLFSAPTAYRMLMQDSNDFVLKYDRSSLRSIHTAGEPIGEAAWHWLRDVVGSGRVEVVDSWWQTETGAAMMSQRPANRHADLVPCVAGKPFYGVKPVLISQGSDAGAVISGEGEGALCMSQPWPGMARGIFADQARFLDTYLAPYPGLYLSGDLCQRRADGLLRVSGRMDDVINVAGHRLATGEVENVLSADDAVSEAAVVSVDDEIKGQRPVAFVICKAGATQGPEATHALCQRLNAQVASRIAKFAVPARIVIVPALPKTRSGKIMRRLLRKIVTGDTDLGDTSTLADPASLQRVAACWAQP